MKTLMIFLLEYRIKKAKKHITKKDIPSFVITAFNNMIKSYETSIIFLKAEKH